MRRSATETSGGLACTLSMDICGSVNNRESRPLVDFFEAKKRLNFAQNSLFKHNSKIEMLLKGEKRLNFAPKRPLRYYTRFCRGKQQKSGV